MIYNAEGKKSERSRGLLTEYMKIIVCFPCVSGGGWIVGSGGKSTKLVEIF